MSSLRMFAEDQVRLVAYYIWKQRSAAGIDGSADGDWYYAEDLIREDGYQAALDEVKA